MHHYHYLALRLARSSSGESVRFIPHETKDVDDDDDDDDDDGDVDDEIGQAN